MAINANNILAGINGAGTSGAELAWFAPIGTTGPTDATAALTSGTSEAQTVTITGSPAGGTFTLTFGGQTTAGIAYNAAASAVQSALVALTTIGTGNVTVTGGPGPGTPYVVTFTNTLRSSDQAQMTASAASLTGGTTPAVTVTTTTPGVAGFESAGLISEDGLSKGVKEDAKDVRAFGLATPVRKIVTSTEVTMKLTFLETNRISESIYGRYPLTGTGAISIVNGAFSVTEGQFRSQRYAFVASVVDGTNYIRYYCPLLEVTGRGDEVIKAGEVIGYEVEATAYPGSDGVAVAKYVYVPGLS
jgi:hypothetical protein